MTVARNRLDLSRSRLVRRKRLLFAMVVVVALLLSLSCTSLGYYTRTLAGGAKILVQREPIHRLLEKGELDPDLERRLQLVLEILTVAHEDLELPDNGSYRSYVELERDAVVWNVMAAPSLSIEPVTWCFPFAGCVSYRGYFSQRRAQRFADKLERRGFDVTVRSVAAYSTLGWFRDPVLSTFLVGDDWQIAAFLMHELAHQKLYVPGDTELNESFATFIEELGVRRFFAARTTRAEDDVEIEPMMVASERERAFTGLVLDYRARLVEIYSSDLEPSTKLQRKADVFDQLRAAYRELSADWSGGPRYDGWFERDLNNADLIPIGDYHGLVPAMAGLYRASGSLDAFYRAVESLGELTPEERRASLAETLAVEAPSAENPGISGLDPESP